MRDWDFSESQVLAEWAESECRHLDLIASWETLMSVYEVLGFIGPDTDEERLAEYKTIIGELNKFLTRMKNGLDKTRDVDDAIEFLLKHANTSDMNTVKGRASIAYNKLKQRWIAQSVNILKAALVQRIEEGEEADD